MQQVKFVMNFNDMGSFYDEIFSKEQSMKW